MTRRAISALFVILSAQVQEVSVSSRNYAPDAGLEMAGVVVRDAMGHAVGGLKAQDFRLLDPNGKPIAIASFSAKSRDATHQPRSIAICFDDFGTGPNNLQRAKAVASRFVQDGMDAQDTAAIGSTFAQQLTEFTGDKTKLLSAIAGVDVHSTPSPQMPVRVRPGQNPGVANGGQFSGFTGEVVARSVLNLFAARIDQLSRLPGNRVIVLLSSGFMGMPEHEQSQVVDKALESGVVINVLDVKTTMNEAPKTADGATPLAPQAFNVDSHALGLEASMAEFAQSTGGLFFHQYGAPFSHGYRELAAIPEITYLLGFRADDVDGKLHRLKAQLASAGNAIEARDAYFPEPHAALSPMRSKLEQQVTAPQIVSDFPGTVGVQYGKLPSGLSRVTVLLHADIALLTFPVQNERHTQQLTLVAVLLDAEGKQVAGKEGRMDFALSAAKYESLKTSGVSASLSLDVPPGRYKLSTVIQEGVSGKMASTLNLVEIP